MNTVQALSVFATALGKASGSTARWWPTSQTGFTCLAWQIALTADALVSPSQKKYLCAAFGKEPAKKAAILSSYGFDPWTTRTRHGHIGYEFLVDFSIYSDSENVDEQTPLLTMESEMHARYSVDHIVDKYNGYSWDYSKLLFVPSKLRIFAACVGTAGTNKMKERRDRLWTTLSTLAELYGKLWSGSLVVYLFGQAKRDRELSELGVWNGNAFDQSQLFPRTP